VNTPIDRAQQALVALENAVAGAKARRQTTNDRDVQNAANVVEHEKTIADLTAELASAENALNALTDKVGALTSNVAGLS
jgi:hypothetical protein